MYSWVCALNEKNVHHPWPLALKSSARESERTESKRAIISYTRTYTRASAAPPPHPHMSPSTLPKTAALSL